MSDEANKPGSGTGDGDQRPDGEGAKAGVAVREAAKPRPTPSKPPVDRLPPYRVILHNDDVNDMLDVVDAIVELTPLGRQRAILVMLEAHTTGSALVLMTHRERAELYREQFTSKKVSVTIEPGG